MAGRSLPPVSAKVVADAEQFIAEFKRADNASRRSAANIDKEVDRLSRSVSQKFSASKFGGDLLKGLGIGSGFAAAQTAASMISDYWAKAAESAKTIAEASERSLKATMAIVGMRQTPEQQRDALTKRLNRLNEEYIQVARELEQRRKDLLDMGVPELPVDSPLFDQYAVKLAELAAQMNETGEALAKIGKEITNATAKTTEEAAKRIIAANEWRTKVQTDHNAALEKEADLLLRRLATPQEEHIARLRRIETLYRSNVITIEQYRRALTDSFETLDKESMKMVEERLKDFFGSLDERSTTMLGGVKDKVGDFAREMTSMWNMVSDRAGAAFADMLMTGENAFDALAKSAVKSILEIMARMAVINPLLNAVFGGMSGWQALPAFFKLPFGGGRSRGGGVEPGVTYRVNENGQEFFKSNVGGTVMPIGSSRGLLGGGGFTYAPVLNIAAGVTKAELLPALMPILRQHGRHLMGLIGEAQRRGAPISAAAY